MTFFVTSALGFRMVDENLRPHTSGPNCWNASLHSLDILNNLRFVHPDEFLYLVSKYCTEAEIPEYGYLGRMFDRFDEVHAYIWIDHNRVYAKHSNRANESYRIMNTTDMLSQYNQRRECALETHPQPICFRQTLFFNCQKFNDHTNLQIQDLSYIEDLIFELIFSPNTRLSYGETCNSNSFLRRSEILIELKELFEEYRNKQIFDEAYLMNWIKSISTQIHESQVNSRQYICRDRTYNQKNVHYRNLFQTIRSIFDK